MGSTTPDREFKLTELMGFLPKQWEAWDAVWLFKYILYGGARGPGKSYWLRWTLLSLLLYWYLELGLRNVTVGLFCDTYPELRDRQITKIKREFPLWLGEVKSTQEAGLGFYLREEYGGGIIALRNLDDPSKYQSAEFAAAAVDELTKISKETFDYLRGSMRWPGVPETKFLGATNPGGIGHLWVKSLWVDGDFSAYPEMKDIKEKFSFIRALPKDNPYLTDDYWDDLNSQPPQLYRAWVEGDWDAFEGQAFSEWRRDRHILGMDELFTPPAHWPKWRAIDWGFAKPWCCLWMTKDIDTDRIYVYRELYIAGLTDKQQAKAIKENTPLEEVIHITYADPSMWTKKNIEDVVTSTADIYAAHGVVLTKADNDRLGGKRKVHRALADMPDGMPGLRVFPQCVNLIRTLPSLPLDKTRVEDVDTDAEDHAYDTLRYGLTNFNIRPKEQVDRSDLPWKRQMRRHRTDVVSKYL